VQKVDVTSKMKFTQRIKNKRKRKISKVLSNGVKPKGGGGAVARLHKVRGRSPHFPIQLKKASDSVKRMRKWRGNSDKV